VRDIPVEIVFDVLPSRLDVNAAADRVLAVAIDLEGRQFTITVRRGIAEVVEGGPLPGGPEISATIETNEQTWKRVALGLLEPTDAVIDGDLRIDNLAVAIEFLSLFVR
jgi:alkyl sulfatase BDS1-like metallo-beta-lactamase superfamily hydrolase